jgi:hypothetical protein
MAQPELYTRVALTRDIPEFNLKRGDTAMYIDDLPEVDGEAGVILEVFNVLGESMEVVTVPLSAIEPLRDDQIFSVRSLVV